MKIDQDAIQQQRREECRRAARQYLSERPGLAFHPDVIRRRVNAEHQADFSEEELQAALSFLEGDEQATQARDAVGATVYFKATSKGILEHERDRF